MFRVCPTTGNDDKDRLVAMRARFGIARKNGFDHSPGRRVLVQTNVSAVLMLVIKILAPKPPEMKFVVRDNVIEQFMKDTAHPTLRHSVLPGTADARAHWLESAGV